MSIDALTVRDVSIVLLTRLPLFAFLCRCTFSFIFFKRLFEPILSASSFRKFSQFSAVGNHENITNLSVLVHELQFHLYHSSFSILKMCLQHWTRLHLIHINRLKVFVDTASSAADFPVINASIFCIHSINSFTCPLV